MYKPEYEEGTICEHMKEAGKWLGEHRILMTVEVSAGASYAVILMECGECEVEARIYSTEDVTKGGE